MIIWNWKFFTLHAYSILHYNSILQSSKVTYSVSHIKFNIFVERNQLLCGNSKTAIQNFREINFSKSSVWNKRSYFDISKGKVPTLISRKFFNFHTVSWQRKSYPCFWCKSWMLCLNVEWHVTCCQCQTIPNFLT